MLILLLALQASVPDVALTGVVLARSGRHAASLVAEGRTRSVLAGDPVFGCQVAAVRADAVDLVCAGVKRTLTLSEAAAKAPAARPAAALAAPEPEADFTIDRADLQSRLDREMSRLITETTLVPVTSRGQVAGFTLSRVPAGTILETLGLKAGDVLVSVNDTPIDSFTTLVGLWPKLQSAGSVRAQIMRDGQPLDISVSIR